jgi:hypothetical protein
VPDREPQKAVVIASFPCYRRPRSKRPYYSRNLAGNPIPVAIVGANHISNSLSDKAKEFVRKHAAEVAVGLVDLEGLRSLAGPGLEDLSSERPPENNLSLPKLGARAPQLFSDLNRWMLKVLLAPRIPQSYLSAPRGQYPGASRLAQAAGVSVMGAFRFVEQFSKDGFLESASGGLRVVRSREPMNRWLGRESTTDSRSSDAVGSA